MGTAGIDWCITLICFPWFLHTAAPDFSSNIPVYIFPSQILWSRQGLPTGLLSYVFRGSCTQLKMSYLDSKSYRFCKITGQTNKTGFRRVCSHASGSHPIHFKILTSDLSFSQTNWTRRKNCHIARISFAIFSWWLNRRLQLAYTSCKITCIVPGDCPTVWQGYHSM